MLLSIATYKRARFESATLWNAVMLYSPLPYRQWHEVVIWSAGGHWKCHEVMFASLCYLVRNTQGHIKLYTKGADTIIFDRLDSSNEDLMYTTSEHLNVCFLKFKLKINTKGRVFFLFSNNHTITYFMFTMQQCSEYLIIRLRLL